MNSTSPTQDETTERTVPKETVQPATAWPEFAEGFARLELRIQQMLVSGLSERQVWHRVRGQVNRDELRRIAKVVAEEGRNPRRPRDVLREQRRPARIRVKTPTRSAADGQPQPARAHSGARQAEQPVAQEKCTPAGHEGVCSPRRPDSLPEPEQLTFLHL
ncbi:hypothetical protein [Streptomyces venezuelae]|uniref:hypothetical protein n=1 Tax=Streptomyces venezuelae TaxID=54571 RepID=UPI0034376BEC